MTDDTKHDHHADARFFEDMRSSAESALLLGKQGLEWLIRGDIHEEFESYLAIYGEGINTAWLLGHGIESISLFGIQTWLFDGFGFPQVTLKRHIGFGRDEILFGKDFVTVEDGQR